jgi:hypothetical protein
MIENIFDLLGVIFIVVPVLLAVLVSIFMGIREIMFK